MSLRNLRKMTSVPDDYGDSSSSVDEARALPVLRPFVNSFAKIALSDPESVKEESDDNTESPTTAPENKKKDKKKKARKNKKRRASGRDKDEVERSVMEVNELLGSPERPADVGAGVAAASVAPPQAAFEVNDILALDPLKLNAVNEMNKLFGPCDDTDRPRNRGRIPNLRRIHKAVIIANGPVQPDNTGMSMTSVDVDGYKSYCFKHSKAYRANHKQFLELTTNSLLHPTYPVHSNYKHPEAALELADFYFETETYDVANNIIENAIYKMQCSFHPLFRVVKPETRLLYRYIENRAFHIAMLKYIHLLTNRACHRTALELAKMLMHLDPTDPCAVIFIVDTLAIRAREFDWLIRAVDFWKVERSADDLFNIKYSYALAHFHAAGKANGDMRKANMLLQDAILSFPWVALDILELIRPNFAAEIRGHKLFPKQKFTFGSTLCLREVYNLYAQFTHSRWAEQLPLEWLQNVVKETVTRLDEDPVFETQAKLKATRNKHLFRVAPVQILRHLCIIKPMASLLNDGTFPTVPITHPWDPIPIKEETIDFPKYTQGSPSSDISVDQFMPPR